MAKELSKKRKKPKVKIVYRTRKTPKKIRKVIKRRFVTSGSLLDAPSIHFKYPKKK